MGEDTRSFAQRLRKNATREENRLWYDHLRDYPVQFRRQVPLGPYVADFYCAQALLVVELDGGQHFEDDGPDRDRERSEYLRQHHGAEVIRFTNLEVKRSFDEVCAAIDRAVERRLQERGR